MHVKKSLMLWVVVLALAIPLILVGTADAGVRYNPDGAVQNPVTGVWELPDASAGCFDGTATIDPSLTNRPDCLNAQNLTLAAIATKSACQTYVQITSPEGVDLKSGTATWSRCSKPLFTADQTTCEGAGGTWSAFSRCNKYLIAADCTQAGGTYASSKCQSTSMSAATCAAGGTIAGTATTWMGSYTPVINGLPATGAVCDIYVGDATSCANAAYAGTMSSTNTDETRGQCSNAWVLRQVAGDGATATSAGTNGSLSTVEARACLRCHNETYQGTGSPFAEPANYIKSSHKNASRKVTAGKNWAGIKATTPESFGVIDNYKTRTIDWSTGKLETTAGSGVYTDMYWFWGYFFEDISNGSDLAENGVKTTGVPTQNFRACTWCHGTGFVANNTLDATKEPVKSFGTNIVWDGSALTPGTYPGVVNFRTPFGRSNVDDSSNLPSTNDCTALGGTISGSGSTKKCIIPAANTNENACVLGGNTIPGTPDWAGAWAGSWSATAGCTVTVNYKYAQWDEFGVECSNCHNSVDGGHNNSATGTRKNVPRETVAQPARGAQINDVCLQCHGKASSGNAQLTAMATELFADPTHVGTGHPNYQGSQFLNSPHARFSGTYSQISDTTKYNSDFTANGGCEACHNPHGSVRENLLDAAVMGASKAEEGLKATCASCHTGNAAAISHVTGTDTPMGASGTATDGCVICHMPGGQHLFRISVDNVTPKNDSKGYNAAWITATTACQQCHAAGKVAASMPFTPAEAAAAAASLHSPVPNPTNTVCLTCHSAARGTKRAVNPGVDHHNGTCTTCHPASNGHFQSAWATAGVAEPNINATTMKHNTRETPNFWYWSVGGSTSYVTTACLGCHAPGKMAGTNIIPSGTGDNHHGGHSSVPGLSFGGVAEVGDDLGTTAGSRGDNDPGMNCLGCHGKVTITGGDSSVGYTMKFAASGLSTSTVAAANSRINTSGLCLGCHEVVQSGVDADHHAGECVSCHNPNGSSTNGTFGAGVGTAPAGGFTCTTACHANKVADFSNTGHANTSRLYTGTELLGPAGIHFSSSSWNADKSAYKAATCLQSDGTPTYRTSAGAVITTATCTPVISGATWSTGYYRPLKAVTHSWFDTGGARAVVDGNDMACMPCHTTGYKVTDFDSTSKGQYPPASWATSSIVITAGNSPIDDTVGTIVGGKLQVGTWDKMGIQCEKCHGMGGVKPADDVKITTMCGECHLTSHDNVTTLNGPHTSFKTPLTYTGTATVDHAMTYSAIQNPANYETNAAVNAFAGRGSCAACHDVHKSTIPSANPAGGAVKECTECHSAGDLGVKVMNHPVTGATGTGASVTLTCESCHMPGGDHTFSIDTSATAVAASSTDKKRPAEKKLKLTLAQSCSTANCHVSRTQARLASVAAFVHSGAGWTTNAGCVGCHTITVPNHVTGAGTPSGCLSCHASYATTHSETTRTLANTCNGCHGAPAIINGGTAHSGTLIAIPTTVGRFTYTFDATTSYVVNFDASTSTDATSFAWNFGDGTTGSGVITSHTYTNTAPRTVTLTLNAGVPVSRTVTPVFVNHAPVALGLVNHPYSANTLAPTIVSSYTVTFADASTDDDGDVITVTVNWGDGNISSGLQGGSFSHSYVRAGKYAITHYAKDSHNSSKTERAYVKIVPPTYTIGGTVKNVNSGAGISYATVYLKVGSHTRAIARANASGVYSLKNVLGGSYTITALKTGYALSSVPTGTVSDNVVGLDIPLAPR